MIPFENWGLQMKLHPIKILVDYGHKTKEEKFHMHINDNKWGSKWMFIDLAKSNRGSLQISLLLQLPFANGSKPYCCSDLTPKKF